MNFFLFILFFFAKSDSDIITTAKKVSTEYNVPNKDDVVIIDYTKPITAERLYLVRISVNRIVLKSTVAHGINSGKVYATEFSNEENSLKSSLGAYQTTSTYIGKYGFSLKLIGLEKGINSNAERRNIVFHSTKKMTQEYSWGCFATPDSINSVLLPLIKNGCLVYVFR